MAAARAEYGRRPPSADRYRRIWALAGEIAANPGQSRGELAGKYHLSVRQLVSDFGVIRRQMALPLINQRGFRFVPEAATSGTASLDIGDLAVLVRILRIAKAFRQMTVETTVSDDALADLVRKIPAHYSAHLQPLASRILAAVMAPRGEQRERVFATIATGLLDRTPLRLVCQPWLEAARAINAQTVLPTQIVCLQGEWWLIAESEETSRQVPMVRVSDVKDAAISPPPRPIGGRR